MVQRVKHLLAMWETWVLSLGWEDPLEKEWQPTLIFLPGKSHGRRSPVQSTVYGVAKSWTRLSNFTSLHKERLTNSQRKKKDVLSKN